MKAWITTLIAAAGLAVAPVWAQQRDEAPPEEPAPQDAPQDTTGAPEGDAGGEDQEQGEGLPDLDELLGLEESEAPGEGGADPQQRALERALTDQEVSDQFKQAVQEMRDAAALLDTARDPGLRTQRIQEDVLKKLDALIEQARNRSQQQQQQSSPRPQDQQQQQRPGQQQQQQQQQANQGDNRQERLPPGRRDGPLRDLVDSESAAWGALPPRVRDTLLQGASDRFSSLYEAMTEAYYRRLAEEADDR